MKKTEDASASLPAATAIFSPKRPRIKAVLMSSAGHLSFMFVSIRRVSHRFSSFWPSSTSAWAMESIFLERATDAELIIFRSLKERAASLAITFSMLPKSTSSSCSSPISSIIEPESTLTAFVFTTVGLSKKKPWKKLKPSSAACLNSSSVSIFSARIFTP